MWKYRKLLAGTPYLAVMIAMALLAGTPLPQPPHGSEPNYQGKTLTDWLRIWSGQLPDIHTAAEQQAAMDEASRSVRAMGTNTIPWLLAWIGNNPPLGPSDAEYLKLPNLIRRDPIPLHSTDTSASRKAFAAMFALEALGSNAVPTIPILTHFLIQTNEVAAWAIVQLRDYALPEVLTAFAAGLTNPSPQVRATAQSVFKELAPRNLRLALQSPIPPVRAAAARAMYLWGDYATPAVPLLKLALLDQDPEVRSAATNALLQIAPEALTNAPAR